MASGNFSDVLFCATLTPHRSLGRRGLVILLGSLAALWGGAGIYFWQLGAWPVAGFFGLDFIAVCVAFAVNNQAGRGYEEVEIRRDALVVRKVDPRGRAREFSCNPLGARLAVIEEQDAVARIVLKTRGRHVRLGAFLNPDDRASFAKALRIALAQAG